jgi:hypothetical protein
VKIEKPGLYLDVDPDAYHSDELPTPSLNQSIVPALVEMSPRHAAALHPRLNPYGQVAESSRAQWLGEATHRLALGRGRQISEIKYPNYQSSSAREARDEAVRNKRIPVLSNELLTVREMAIILRRLIEEEFQGKEYFTEVMIAWQEETPFGPIWCRSLVDAYCPELAYVLDPKVLRIPATPEAFGPTAARSGYDIQGALQTRGFGMLFPELEGRFRFANLVVEKEVPHGCRAMAPDPISRDAAAADVQAAIDLWGRCLHAREWRGYPHGAAAYSTPAWRHKRTLERADAQSEEDHDPGIQSYPSVPPRSPAPDWDRRPTGGGQDLQRAGAGDGDQSPPWRPYSRDRYRARSGVAIRAAEWRDRQRGRSL